MFPELLVPNCRHQFPDQFVPRPEKRREEWPIPRAEMPSRLLKCVMELTDNEWGDQKYEQIAGGLDRISASIRLHVNRSREIREAET